MPETLPLSTVLGRVRAKHLLRRTTYNYTKERLDSFSQKTLGEALDLLISTNQPSPYQPVSQDGYPMVDVDDNLGPLTPPAEDFIGSAIYSQVTRGTDAWWYDNAIKDPTITSRMTYFLYSFIPSISDRAKRGEAYDYLQLLRHYCLGDFKDFIYQVTINSSMLRYLTNESNTKEAPNENFAREVLELFTIGKGPLVADGDFTHYTEQDVVEAARLLTGWESHPVRVRTNNNPNGRLEDNGNIPVGIPNPSKHDFGEKTFSHRFQNRTILGYNPEGENEYRNSQRMKKELRLFYDMIFDQEETAKYICRRMYRYFLDREISARVERDIIEPLATVFRTNYNFEETLRTLFSYTHFYKKFKGGMIKSPLELALQTYNVLEYPVPENTTTTRFVPFYENLRKKFLALASQIPFFPPSVAGFPALYEAPDFDKYWFSSTTLIPRFGIKEHVLWDRSPLKVTPFIEKNISDPSNVSVLMNELVDLLFARPIPQERKDYFSKTYLLDDDSISPTMWRFEWEDYVSTNDSTGVEIALKSLVKALISSHEYQIN